MFMMLFVIFVSSFYAYIMHFKLLLSFRLLFSIRRQRKVAIVKLISTETFFNKTAIIALTDVL